MTPRVPHAAALAFVLQIACVREGEYRCTSSDQCELAEPGTCEPGDLARSPGDDNPGACSFPDEECDSGRRYGELSGERSEECVACGALWQPCCRSTPCESGTTCGGGLLCSCVRQLATGSEHSCALAADGSVWCWGGNDYGQLGDGTRESPRAIPQQVVDLPPARFLVAGVFHSCAIDESGAVWCWGQNSGGLVSSEFFQTTPARGLLAIPAAHLAAGQFRTCAVGEDGSIWCWGGIDGPTPTQITGFPGPAVEVALAGDTACARLEDGSLWCWGRSDSGQAGTGNNLNPSVPTRNELSPVATDLSMGFDHGCAVVVDGSVWCWGSVPWLNPDGPVFSPEKTSLADAVEVIAGGAAGEASFDCARLVDGSIACFEDGGSVSFLEIDSPAQTFAASNIHGCLSARGGISCWGVNDNGQLGNDDLVSQAQPVPSLFTCP